MVCLGFKPGAAGWKARMNPLSYGGTPFVYSKNNHGSVTSKKSPNVYKSCPKMSSQEKLKTLTPLQKLPKIVRDLGKLIVAKGFEKFPKMQ